QDVAKKTRNALLAEFDSDSYHIIASQVTNGIGLDDEKQKEKEKEGEKRKEIIEDHNEWLSQVAQVYRKKMEKFVDRAVEEVDNYMEMCQDDELEIKEQLNQIDNLEYEEMNIEQNNQKKHRTINESVDICIRAFNALSMLGQLVQQFETNMHPASRLAIAAHGSHDSNANTSFPGVTNGIRQGALVLTEGGSPETGDGGDIIIEATVTKMITNAQYTYASQFETPRKIKIKLSRRHCIQSLRIEIARILIHLEEEEKLKKKKDNEAAQQKLDADKKEKEEKQKTDNNNPKDKIDMHSGMTKDKLKSILGPPPPQNKTPNPQQQSEEIDQFQSSSTVTPPLIPSPPPINASSSQIDIQPHSTLIPMSWSGLGCVPLQVLAKAAELEISYKGVDITLKKDLLVVLAEEDIQSSGNLGINAALNLLQSLPVEENEDETLDEDKNNTKTSHRENDKQKLVQKNVTANGQIHPINIEQIAQDDTNTNKIIHLIFTVSDVEGKAKATTVQTNKTDSQSLQSKSNETIIPNFPSSSSQENSSSQSQQQTTICPPPVISSKHSQEKQTYSSEAQTQ
ncbi:MAG: hypothetical protein EZS28_039955, partial [Streblomastix strix]